MNIQIPHQWLCEFLETKVEPSELARLLSLAGPSVEKLTESEGDWVYDLEITSNRVDAFSVAGVAREAAAILRQAGHEARFLPPAPPPIPKPDSRVAPLPLPQIEFDQKLCRRLTCIVLDQVQSVATPAPLAKRLRQVDLQVHQATIDITNYLCHELGYPCHAFDYHKLMALGGGFRIREASAATSVTTLDGRHHHLLGGEIVYESFSGEIIDLPSVMGALNTAVDEKTSAILLLLESIEPERVRWTSMTHALRTTAAQILEKEADPELMSVVLARGVELYQTIAGARVASPLFDDYPHPPSPQAISLSLAQLTSQLEVELTPATVSEILAQLGCQVTSLDSDKLSVTPASFRPDLLAPIDLVEEIARIYGYHNLPSRVMATALPLNPPSTATFQLESQLGVILSLLGWQELYTYSLVSAELAQASGFPLEAHLKLKNPLSSDRLYLRRSLLPSLQEALAANPLTTDLSVFELAHLYHPQTTGLPIEELHLTLLSRRDYRTVRGDFEALAAKLFLPPLEIRPEQPWANQAEICYQTSKLGSLGQLPSGEIYLDLILGEIAPLVQTHPSYQPLPKTAFHRQMLTFTLGQKQPVGDILAAINHFSPLITQVTLDSIYDLNYAFKLEFHDPSKNLTSEEVEEIRLALIQAIESRYQAKLVGEAGHQDARLS